MADSELTVKVEPTEEVKAEAAKVGARNSRMDQTSLDTAHDALVMAGANCPGAEAPKSYREAEKTITDAPNLRGERDQKCLSCAYYKMMPPQETALGDTMWQGICTKHEFMTQENMVCDDWEMPEPMESKSIANVLKAISKTDDEFRVGNYIILHGGRDLTAFVPKEYGGGPNPDGSKGEFFSEKTDVESNYTKAGVLHVDFEHGWDTDKVGIGKHDILGYVDWKTAKRDRRGVFVERVLNRRNEYVQWLEELIEAGLIGNSSEAVPEGIEKAKNGEILKWPLHRDTLTVNPMEPRMLSQNAFTAIKHLAEVAPRFKALLQYVSDSETNEAQVMSDGETSVTETVTNNFYGKVTLTDAVQPLTAKENEMADSVEGKVVTPEFDYEKLADMVAKKIDVPGVAKAAPAVIKSENLGDPDPYRALARWAMGGSTKGIGALGGKFLNENQLHFDGAKAALQEASGEGAELVPDDFFPQIVAKRDQAAIARRAGARVLQTSRDVLNIPAENASMANFSITAEEAAYTENEPTFTTVAVTVYKFTKVIKVSEELLDDDATNLDSFLVDGIGRAWALTENDYTLVGTGSGQPQGVFVGGSVGYTFADTNAIAATEIPSLYWSLGEPYHNGAAWVTKGAHAGSLQGLTGNNFQLVQTPYMPDQMIGDSPFPLWGKPVYLSDSVAAMTTGLKPIVFGNWNFYALVERRGLTISRNPYLYQANGQVGIFVSVRFGGAVLQSEAFKWGILA